MCSPRDVHKSDPVGTDQALQHVHIIFQGIIQGPHLPSSCYAAAEGGVDPQPCDAVVTYKEDSESDEKYSVMPPLIYPEDYDGK